MLIASPRPLTGVRWSDSEHRYAPRAMDPPRRCCPNALFTAFDMGDLSGSDALAWASWA